MCHLTCGDDKQAYIFLCKSTVPSTVSSYTLKRKSIHMLQVLTHSFFFPLLYFPLSPVPYRTSLPVEKEILSFQTCQTSTVVYQRGLKTHFWWRALMEDCIPRLLFWLITLQNLNCELAGWTSPSTPYLYGLFLLFRRDHALQALSTAHYSPWDFFSLWPGIAQVLRLCGRKHQQHHIKKKQCEKIAGGDRSYSWDLPMGHPRWPYQVSRTFFPEEHGTGISLSLAQLV